MMLLMTIIMLSLSPLTSAFLTPSLGVVATASPNPRPLTARKMAEDKMAKQVTGAELEKMLQEWDTPLVVDAYATW